MNHSPRFRERLIIFVRAVGLLLAVGLAGLVVVRHLQVETAQAESLLAQSRAEQNRSHPAAAALALARARLVAPRAAQVRSALAQAAIAPPANWLERDVSLVAPREWSALVLVFGWVAGMSVALWLFLPKSGRLARRVAAAAAVCLSMGGAGFTVSSRWANALAVIERPSGALLAPYDGAGATADLRPGVVVRTGEHYADFIRIDGPNGVSGWVPASALAAVVGG